MELENLLLSQENQSPPPSFLDSAETLGGQILEQETCAQYPSALSPWSEVNSPDASEFDSFKLLEDENDPKGTEGEEDAGLVDWKSRNTFSSDCDSHWSEPWPAAKWQNNETARIGAGLSNLGNTCFLNAVLQCFIHTVPLLDGIYSDKQPCSCKKEMFCILCTLRELVELSLTSTNGVISPWKLVNNLSSDFSSGFQRFQQEDAHEFLQCFLDRLESCHDSMKKDTGSSHDNIVKQVFGGRLVSKLKCCNCGHCSDTYEPSIDLSLEIEEADILLTALQSFTKLEKIEDSDTKFTCEDCKEQVSIEKQLAFDQTPSVAVFHLKRFKNNGSFVEKIEKHVAFPNELDLLPFTSNGKMDNAELKYVLYAVVVHTGSTSTSGHYYCFIRLSPDTWFKFDDSRVVLVPTDFVLSQEAYILFYARDGIPWFSSFVETDKLCLSSLMYNTSPKSVLENVHISSFSPAPQKIYICESNEASDDTGLIHDGFSRNDDEDSKPRLNKLDHPECKDKSYQTPISVTLDGNQREVSLSSHAKVRLPEEASIVGSGHSISHTFPRSPSPEIYREDPMDAGFSIPREHLRLVGNPCKRRLDKDIDDVETKVACSFIKKSIPGSRGQQLLAELRGSRSEGSQRKKSRHSGLSQRRDEGSVTRPVHRRLVASGSR